MKRKPIITSFVVLLILTSACSAGTPRSLSLPTAAPTTHATPTVSILKTGAAPEFISKQYQSGTFTDPPSVLAVRNGVPAYESIPIYIQYYWDYSRLSGRLVYSPRPNHASADSNRAVTDLWIYDYANNKAEMWLPDNVSSAAWSPVINSQTHEEYLAAAVYDNQTHHYDLVVLARPNHIVRKIPNASPNFSWSPDGQQLAFYSWSATDSGEGVYVASITRGDSKKIASLGRVGSIYERPVWAQEHQAIIYNASGLYIAPLDGSGIFTPTTINGQRPSVPFQYAMLWSPQKRLLILAGQAGETPAKIEVYELSEDLRKITNSYTLAEDVTLSGWLVKGETLILEKDDSGKKKIEIWSLQGK